jgi:hypothetical protein
MRTFLFAGLIYRPLKICAMSPAARKNFAVSRDGNPRAHSAVEFVRNLC